MKLLITGAGSLASELIKQLHKQCRRLVVFSRSESRQGELKKHYPEGGRAGLRYFIGDIRDVDRLTVAMRGVDYVIHTAALKVVPTGEYNPSEFIKTNITGSENVAIACNRAGVKKCILSSTDKAVNPINLYGMTKGCAEKLFIAYNNLGDCRFSVCRYGNVAGSTGSVIPLWERQSKNGELTITDKRMTRFWITLEQAGKFIYTMLERMYGGEIFIPKINKMSMVNLANKLFSDMTLKETGIRPGEKLHESLLNEEESRECYSRKDDLSGIEYYCVYPGFHEWGDIPKLGTRLSETFTLTSEDDNVKKSKRAGLTLSLQRPAETYSQRLNLS